MTHVAFYFIYLLGLFFSPCLNYFSNISVLIVRLERICDSHPFGDTTTHDITYIRAHTRTHMRAHTLIGVQIKTKLFKRHCQSTIERIFVRSRVVTTQ
jgi:hypothetical protein